ncbi:pX [Mastadenovirus eidoli]|uniref:PX n=1 Tax=Eidolon helvum adenovirus TaxID=2039267 RepID=A0A348FKG6_9ADEN|nr:pX [Eidolon helvum adenovirus]BBF72833.1 pX [Eidolon helvum adenovirus]
MVKRAVTYRIRVPVTRRMVRTNSRRHRHRHIRKKLKGGFFPALVPLIAAAIGAIPGIASVALEASRKS